MDRKSIFKDFSEYWYYARPLSEKQREIIYSNLSDPEKSMINDSYLIDGWSDVFCRNKIDEIIDQFKYNYGFDIIEVKLKALKGDAPRMPKQLWNLLISQLKEFRMDSVGFILSGIKAVPSKEDEKIVIIVSENK